MTKQEEFLKQQIMQRVLFVYGLKRLPAIFLPKVAIFSTLLALCGFFVSVPNVLKNMPSLLETQKFLQFMTSAFLNTRLIIQIVAVAVVIVLFYMVKDLVKTFSGKVQALTTA
ncbi:MAG: hypothetical protein V4467_01110 [Patescibacteria group bacterium]